MFYLIDECGKICNSSNTKIVADGYTTIEKDFNDEELEKIKKGYSYIDGEFIPSEQSIKNEIKEKLTRMKEIRAKLIDLGYSTELPGDSRLFPKLEAQKKALLDEWEQIKLEVDENYESNLIDDVINSFFE